MNELTFHESYGYLTPSLLRVIQDSNVTVSDWDFMLLRWGYVWGDMGLPFDDIERHITTHTYLGSYHYPMYGG